MSDPPYVTIRSRRPADGSSMWNNDSAAPSGSGDLQHRSATHDISRTSFHVKHIDQFARRLEDSASRAFPNRSNISQRYKKVQALLLHWGSDDLFVLPELEDLERCLREDYSFGTDIWAIPSDNSHLELMMKLGQLIKEHESPDNLFLIYYGGHARIDESRQSTWCATRDADSAWLQWSAIQTLLERSKSDVLILLDCCAGAASATFPTGNSITETISASSWDAIAPDPGRYSFTNALIEVLQEWRMRTYSAAMLHAEVLARLKHPRPININGKQFEARSTPVHFMMTSNHRAPSIEICRTQPVDKESSPAATESLGQDSVEGASAAGVGAADAASDGLMSKEPNEDTPHVMISLALEEDQSLDINAWQQWLGAFPAMAKYVKVQGVFKSHSTLLLVSMPVMIWDLLPEDPATSFIAFIRSNNMVAQSRSIPPPRVPVFVQQPHPEATGHDTASLISGVSGTTYAATENTSLSHFRGSAGYQSFSTEAAGGRASIRNPLSGNQAQTSMHQSAPFSASTPPTNAQSRPLRVANSSTSLGALPRATATPPAGNDAAISRQMILNQQQSQRRTTVGNDVPEPRRFANHIERRLEDYYQHEPLPTDAQRAFFASNLGIDTFHLEVWFHHRRGRDMVADRLAAMKINDVAYEGSMRPQMILPADLSRLLDMSLPGQVVLLDSRPPTDYAKSHIYGAVNLRAPRSFIQAASLETIGRAVLDGQGRRVFSTLQRARCFVCYSKAMEFPWECSMADLILEKLRAQNWTGHCFILKGHYREFSISFDKYITGAKTTAEAQKWIDGQTARTAMAGDFAANQEAYVQWLTQVETEDRFRPTTTSPENTVERVTALEALERELEAEFQARHKGLHHRVLETHGDGSSRKVAKNLDTEAQMVEYLDRGLSKVRGSQAPASAHANTYEPGYSKTGGEAGFFDRSYFDRDVGDEYVEVSRNDESVPGAEGSQGSHKAPGESRTPPEETARRGRGGNLISKVFRRS
ncbi:hypothetical protein S7711_03019 [Stachybotrys chartarum IBT 7711]|uniref:Uncharacterized protein n=1 Tax=Stachybotrys chartarum (strain CBS 109288 / IBT 7711) TaxID=1280523 RepID=A0A084APD0_STACB|nr:hypothetical protein S7711_03019 [Stachybotrys chartarum IBT 7711]